VKVLEKFCIIAGGAVSKISFVTDVTQEVVYTSEEPSLVMTYDRHLGVHSIWNLRQTKPKACRIGCKVYAAKILAFECTGSNIDVNNNNKIMMIIVGVFLCQRVSMLPFRLAVWSTK